MEGKNIMEGKSVCTKTQIFSCLALSLGIIGLIVAGYLTGDSVLITINGYAIIINAYPLIIIACAIFSVVFFASFLYGIYRSLKKNDWSGTKPVLR